MGNGKVFVLPGRFKNFQAFDIISLFRKLLDCETPIAVMRILLFWYSKQTVVKWGTCMSDYFCISNGVRQCGFFCPKLFSIYVDDISNKLIKTKIGYHIPVS